MNAYLSCVILSGLNKSTVQGTNVDRYCRISDVASGAMVVRRILTDCNNYGKLGDVNRS